MINNILGFFSPHPHHTSRMLGIEHILIMVITYSLIIFIGYKLKDISKKKRDQLYKIIAIVILILDPLYWLWEYLTTKRINYATTLPLYYCSIFILAIALFAFSKEGSKIKKVSCNFICTMNIICSLLGTIFLVYLNEFPIMHFVIIRSLIFHFTMVLVPSIILFSGEYKYSKSDWYSFMFPAMCIFIPAFIVDLIFGFDYGYFNGGIGTPVNYFIKSFKPIVRLFLISGFFFGITNILVRPLIKKFVKSYTQDAKCEKEVKE